MERRFISIFQAQKSERWFLGRSRINGWSFGRVSLVSPNSTICFLQQGPSHGVNVVAIDPPGHGFSEDWSKHLAVDDVKTIWSSILEQLQVEQAVIGGHSYGAYCALMGDSMLQHYVKGAVLFDGGYEPSRDNLEQSRLSVKKYIDDTAYTSWEAYLEDEKRYTSYWDDDLSSALRSYVKEIDGNIRIRMSVKAAWDGLSLMHLFDPAEVAETEKPVLLLRATLPDAAKEQREIDTAALSQRLKSLQTVPVPNAGHSVITDNRQFVMKSVWEFLSHVYD